MLLISIFIRLFPCIRPQGAFYLFPKSPLADEMEFIRLAQKYRILLVPGTGFGAPGFGAAGLGASGGLARLGAFAESAVAPEHVRASEYFGRWGEHPLSYYLVFMLVGTFLGGLFSATLAGRVKVAVE